MVTAICLPRLQPCGRRCLSQRPTHKFPATRKKISHWNPGKGFFQTRALIKWKGEFQKPFSTENSTKTTTTRLGFRRDIAWEQALHSSHARAARERRRKSITGELGGIAHVRYLNAKTFKNLNVKMEVKFLTGKVENLNGKVWTPRALEGLRRENRGSVNRLENYKQILWTWIYESCYYSLCLEIFYGSTVPCEQRKNIEQFRVNKCPTNFFSRSKSRPVPWENSLNYFVTGKWKKKKKTHTISFCRPVVMWQECHC